MNFIKHLQAAGVPDHYHAAAVNALQGARERAQGLNWAKWKVRLLKPGKLHLRIRVGYEVSNVWHEPSGQQAWYPIAGHDLRAPVTWSVLPGWGVLNA